MIFKNRRAMLFLTAFCTAVIAALVVFDTLRSNKTALLYRKSFFSMDTFVDVRSESNITKDIAVIFGEYNTALSCNDENAETARLNRDGKTTASDILCSTVNETLYLNEKYGMLTDITVGRLTSLWNVTSDAPVVPGHNKIKSALETIGKDSIAVNGTEITLKDGVKLDFGAVGKGAALDGCYKYLKENNCNKTIISTGSSLLFYGSDSFSADIADPDGNGSFANVKTKYSFLSTSGGYERYFEADGKIYCHIIDPRTGYPTETDLTTVTVFCNSGIESDFLSTMIFMDGSENIKKYLDASEYKIFAADRNKKLYVSDGLDYEIYNKKYSE